jgi:hypothetical protein
MGPKKTVKNDEKINVIDYEEKPCGIDEKEKPKRGRKSKKELMESLNMQSIVPEPEKKKSKMNAIAEQVVKQNLNDFVSSDDGNDDNINGYDKDQNEQKVAKKRGRKPKGGKIIQQLQSSMPEKEAKPNVILHLKCSMKDLQTNGQPNTVESYNFSSGVSGDLGYEIINGNNIQVSNFNDKDDEYDDNCDDDISCKDTVKELWRKIKQLEHNLHINNVGNKRSCCFWDTCEFDNPPIYIPKHFINGTYQVYGCFCSPECAVAHLMNENIDSSIKFERYHLFNHIYSKIYDYKKNVKPAPNPYYMLDKFYGNLSIKEYRSLLKNERLFLIVDKPLTKIMPELHEDNDDFILNNKIIPSSGYQLKNKARKKQSKNVILNEKFGNPAAIE